MLECSRKSQQHQSQQQQQQHIKILLLNCSYPAKISSDAALLFTAISELDQLHPSHSDYQQLAAVNQYYLIKPLLIKTVRLDFKEEYRATGVDLDKIKLKCYKGQKQYLSQRTTSIIQANQEIAETLLCQLDFLLTTKQNDPSNKKLSTQAIKSQQMAKHSIQKQKQTHQQPKIEVEYVEHSERTSVDGNNDQNYESQILSQIEMEQNHQQQLNQYQSAIEEKIQMIQQYDDKLLSAQNEIKNLREKMGQLIKENERCFQQINHLNQTQPQSARSNIANSANNQKDGAAQGLDETDSKRQDTVQLQIIEQLVKDKNKLTLEILKLKEDNQNFRELKNQLSPQQMASPRNLQIKEILPNHIAILIKHLLSKTQSDQDSILLETLTPEEQLQRLQIFIENQQATILNLATNQQQLQEQLQLQHINMKNNRYDHKPQKQFKLSQQDQDDSQNSFNFQDQGFKIDLQKIQMNSKFMSYIDVQNLEQIYKEFFNHHKEIGNSSNHQNTPQTSIQNFSRYNSNNQQQNGNNNLNSSQNSNFNSNFKNSQVNNIKFRYLKFIDANNTSQLSVHQLFKQIELKNRCFKDLYNLLEDAVFKFYDLYVQAQANYAKNLKLEETFNQLDQVFNNAASSSANINSSQLVQGNIEGMNYNSNSGLSNGGEGRTSFSGSNDRIILDELRRLNNHILQEMFDLQREIAMYKSIEGAPLSLVKILKKSADKHSKKFQSVSGMMTLEDQVNDLNNKIREQDKQLRLKEKKVQNTKKQSNLRKSQMRDDKAMQNMSSVDYSSTLSVNKQASLLLMSTEKARQEYSLLESHYQESCANLEKAIDQLSKQDEQLQTLEKEKTLHILEINKLKADLDRAQSEKSLAELRFREAKGQYDSLISDKEIYESNLKQLNDQIQEIMVVIEDYQSKIERLEQDSESLTKENEKLRRSNEELRGLVEQERRVYQEEKQKSDELIDQLIRQQDSKFKIVKQRIQNLIYSEIGQEKFIPNEQYTFEDLLSKIQQIISALKERLAQAEQGFLNNTCLQTLGNQFNKSRELSPVKAALDQSRFIANQNDSVGQPFNTASKNDQMINLLQEYKPTEIAQTENLVNKAGKVQNYRDQERGQLEKPNCFELIDKQEEDLRISLRNPQNNQNILTDKSNTVNKDQNDFKRVQKDQDYYKALNDVKIKEKMSGVGDNNRDQSTPSRLTQRDSTSQQNISRTRLYNYNQANHIAQGTENYKRCDDEQRNNLNQKNEYKEQSSKTNSLSRQNSSSAPLALTPNRLHLNRNKLQIIKQANDNFALPSNQYEYNKDNEGIRNNFQLTENKISFNKTQNLQSGFEREIQKIRDLSSEKRIHYGSDQNSKENTFRIHLIKQKEQLLQHQNQPNTDQIPSTKPDLRNPSQSTENNQFQSLQPQKQRLNQQQQFPHQNSKQTQRLQNNGDESNQKSMADILTNFKREKDYFNEKLSLLKTKLEQVKSPEKFTTNHKPSSSINYNYNQRLQININSNQEKQDFGIPENQKRVERQQMNTIDNYSDNHDNEINKRNIVETNKFQTIVALDQNTIENHQFKNTQILVGKQNQDQNLETRQNAFQNNQYSYERGRNEGRQGVADINGSVFGELEQNTQILNRRAKTTEKIKYH